MMTNILTIPEAVIIGGQGKVGRAFSNLLPSAPVVSRGDNLTDALNKAPNCPILVCTTNDALDPIIRATPPLHRSDLIFIQNGMLLPELRKWKLESQCTQVLLYLAAGSTGQFTDGKQTVCIGKWAPWFSDVLHGNSLQCSIAETRVEYNKLMINKLLWACIFWMMSAGLDGAPVGQIIEQNSADVRALVDELIPLAEAEVGPLDSETAFEAVIAYSLSIPTSVPSKEMALREFEWRNGWFLRRRENGGGVHVEWLKRAGVENEVLRKYGIDRD